MPKQPSKRSSQVNPSPELEKRGRRTYIADYKLKIIAAADAELASGFVTASDLL